MADQIVRNDHVGVMEPAAAQEQVAREKENIAIEVNADREPSLNITDLDEKTQAEADYLDPYVPFPIDVNAPPEGNILTVRAIVLGCALGALVNASNLYLGLKTGWTFGANLFGAIFGFGILKSLSVTKIPLLGGFFGPMENNIVQTSATAAGGLGIIFVGCIPALYQLNLMSKDPQDDYWKLICFTAVAAYFGLCFAVPLRKFFIIHVARDLSLIYPTATATAMSIRSMHMSGTGMAIAQKKVRALGITFGCAFVWRVLSQYAPGILWDWNIFWWFYVWGHYKNLAVNISNWGWLIEWTPAFIGSGMLVGLNGSLSFFLGSVIAWGIIGPALVHNGAATGISASDNYPEIMSFSSLSLDDPKNNPSPRYWLLWPGLLLMIATSFAELAINYKLIVGAGKSVWKGLTTALNDLLEKRGKHSPWLARQAAKDHKDLVQDPSPPEDQVRTWMWMLGALVVVIFTCVVLGEQFKFTVGMSILSLVLGFIFAFLAIQCTGATDTTPVTTVAKASQLIFGGVTKGMPNVNVQNAQLLNLMGGAISAGAASQSTDLTNDFKVGFLLRTPPQLQWYAQAIGSFVSIWLAPSLFLLFAKAYPCILDVSAETCAFAAPSVSAWRAVAIAMTDPDFPIPPSSGIFAIVFAIFGVGLVFFRHWCHHSGRKHWTKWIPNMLIMGLAFLLPQTQYGTAMSMGAVITNVWQAKNMVSFEIYGYSVAAGLIAGEGIGGVVNALFQVVKISGPDYYGSTVGCVDSSC